MKSLLGFVFKDIYLSLSVSFLLVLSLVILSSLAPSLFPFYFVLVVVSMLAFWLFSQLGYEVVAFFSKHLYIISIALLVLTLIIGNVTRGTIRWIPIGPFNLQPAEIARPFLLVFFAEYLTKENMTAKRFITSLGLLLLPVGLILVQPSLGVSILTSAGFLGVLVASRFNKKYILVGLVLAVAAIPLFWQIMAPYQRQRVTSFLGAGADPLGADYNSIQSQIAAGAGGLSGRGLGKGIQTQLSFLPAKQTDFIFSSVGEELGFIGAGLMLLATFTILFRLTVFMEKAINPSARAFLSGLFVTYLLQVFIHAGMNLGILPVTGIPFPLVSAGGSSLLATMIALGIAAGSYKGK
ncbi:MAG TPA: FtsW/RodA/SpoVE family cell cycle protein [Patescibacteria group bacterium]|nr:FtsW/RodA/SpoVE family cell cycle protein [Patescibacteria group bacterium]